MSGADGAAVMGPLLGTGKCVGACCPASASCYSSANGLNSPGAECLATHDNTAMDHIQLRQAWVKSTTPLGTAASPVYSALNARTQLPAPECHQGMDVVFGSGGYIQLVDYYVGGSKKAPTNLADDYSTIGYSTFVSANALPGALTDGLCFGEEVSGGPAASYALTTVEITNHQDRTNYPPGLPLPMGAKDVWRVGPTRAKRIDKDFSLPDERLHFLAMFAIDPYSYTGAFYYDEATGYVHRYDSLIWSVLYSADGSTHLVIPVREVETKTTFNDPAHPNCIGAYRANALDLSSDCVSTDPNDPAWGCLSDQNCRPGEGPATTTGYSLITELEQVYSPDLGSTLCVTYPGTDSATTKPFVDAQGFWNATDKSCKTAKWDPTLPDQAGLPMGDWCAATNSRATATCHDAWQTKAFQVFTAGKIKLPADPAAATTTCRF
jgi:hypothetical protein